VSNRFGLADHWIGGMALSGRGEVIWLEGFPSHAAIGALMQTYQATAGLEAASDSVWRDTGGHLEAADVLWAFHRPDLGYKPVWFTPAARAFQVITFRVKPGMEADGEAVFRTFASAYAAAAVDVPWATYQVSNGMAGPTYLMIVPMTSLAAIDRDLAAMGTVVSKVPDVTGLMAQWARAGNSVTSNVYGVVPSLSRVGQDWAAAGGGFWGR
ncbi:MAG TPA: hypothetical protein VJ773_10185, partial [Gemmatimonadales bacterium]|nr:hypothetical protein [Gemmatimonadales bacterium]